MKSPEKVNVRNTLDSVPTYQLEMMKNAERLRGQNALVLVAPKGGAVPESNTAHGLRIEKPSMSRA